MLRRDTGTEIGGTRALLGVVLGSGLVLAVVAAPASQAEWRETVRDEGIVVTERSVPGQRVPTFRAIGLIEADLPTVLAVIGHVERHPEWLRDCTDARTIAREGADVTWVYHRTNVPWPLADRDVILRHQVEIQAEGRIAFVHFEAAPEMLPVVDGVVRVTTLRGFYRLEALGSRRTSVEYRVDVEPAGSLPDWIQHQATRSVPLDTVAGLRRQSMLLAAETPVLAVGPAAVVSPSGAAGVTATEPSYDAGLPVGGGIVSSLGPDPVEQPGSTD